MENEFIWRGFPKPENINFFSKYPRSDRQPLSTSPKLHAYFDKFFEDVFGFKYRSGAVFASRERHEAID